MPKDQREKKVDRQTSFACLSVPASKISKRRRDEIIAAFNRKGWGVLVEKHRLRFIHFDDSIVMDVTSILDGLDCDKTGWTAYRLSFPTVEATKAIVDSAQWK
jgi:hypothetical protein